MIYPAPKILRLDIGGQPVGWLSWQQAAVLYSLGKIAWTHGDNTFQIHGGHCRLTGLQSQIVVHSIVAIKGHQQIHKHGRKIPPLDNSALFLRDANLCLYCGNQFPTQLLTRDHVMPLSQGGDDCWSNVVASCHSCNTRKGGHTPEQAHMPLLAIPFVPNHAEYLALSNRRILADQMDFLKAQFRNHDRRPMN